jgi:DNA-binding CsgD family transcriptional regulator
MNLSSVACMTCGAESSTQRCEACGAELDLAILEVIRGAQKGTTFPLGPRAYVLGRSREADIVLHDTSVSRRHARISWEPDGYSIEDLGSAHGIYVDQRRPSREHLQPGCLIQIGGVTLRFDVVDADAVTAPDLRLPWLIPDAEGGVGSQAAAAALDRLHLGVVLVDRGGRVVAKNRSASEILAEHDGIELRAAVLHVADTSASRRLRGLLASADAGPLRGGVLTVPRRPPRAPLTLLVAPLGGRTGGGDVPVVKAVFISTRDRGQETGEEHLRRLYDLTPSEAGLASLLVTGLSLKVAAVKLTITENTARTHLKRIFEKTDTHRQGELVGLLLSGPGQIRED